MKTYKFDVWKDDSTDTKEVLVVAESEEEAEEKLTNADLGFDYDNYDIMDDDEFDAVIL